MLPILIPEQELFDSNTNEFYTIKERKIRLEHSLISISKWESKWKRSFIDKPPAKQDEIFSYIKFMLLDNDVSDDALKGLTQKNISDIFEYINDPMSATTVTNSKNGKTKKEILTSEVIYAYMAIYGIPFSCEKWHLNRLIKLIQVCADKNNPPEKMGKNDIFKQNRSLNAARRAAMHSKG